MRTPAFLNELAGLYDRALIIGLALTICIYVAGLVIVAIQIGESQTHVDAYLIGFIAALIATFLSDHVTEQGVKE